jgi:hypothetical protein
MPNSEERTKREKDKNVTKRYLEIFTSVVHYSNKLAGIDTA